MSKATNVGLFIFQKPAFEGQSEIVTRWQAVRTATATKLQGTTFAAPAGPLFAKASSRMSVLRLSSRHTKNSAGTVAVPEDRANAVEADHIYTNPHL
jgi:hypothetical protein